MAHTELRQAPLGVQDIFGSGVIKSLEIEILDTQFEQERHCYADNAYTHVISRLLEIRRNQLNQLFVLTDEYKVLLAEFNEALSKAILRAAHQAEAVRRLDWSNAESDVKIYTKCFLGYRHSPIHPVQTIRAKKIWAILAGCIDSYDAMYSDGIVYGGIEACSRGEIFDERQTNQLLYGFDTPDNWNDGLDPEMTKDMHLSRHFHNLYDHCLFSIFDLLWVREFDFETHAEYDSRTYPDDATDDLEWNKPDYYD